MQLEQAPACQLAVDDLPTVCSARQAGRFIDFTDPNGDPRRMLFFWGRTFWPTQGVNAAFHSHVSLVKFRLQTFGLAPFSAVPAFAPDDRSDNKWDCFDFAAPPRKGAPSAQTRGA